MATIRCNPTFPVGEFQFVAIQTPGEARDPVTRRLARSHAVKQALKHKRQLQQEARDNFRVTTSKDKPRRVASKEASVDPPPTSLFCLGAGKLDPFQTLAVDSVRLQVLLGDYAARHAPEPVFSVAQELSFQDFHSVFRTGFTDPALLNAVMLSLAFSVTGGRIDQECLSYRGRAIGHVREKMGSLDEATSETTIGAILLLAGVEARLGMISHVQTHMKAVQLLLDACKKKGVYLTGGIKRAMFWQDMNFSILTKSDRIFSHTTFSELLWARDPFSPNFFRLPPGFQTKSHLLTEQFIEILEDINALQCIRDFTRSTTKDVMLMAHVNNHAASIQSRLVDLSYSSPVLECCYLAAYICSVVLCCKFPYQASHNSERLNVCHVSPQLLHRLQQTIDDPDWDEQLDLLLWLIYMGGSFAPAETIRPEYVDLLQTHAVKLGGLYASWPETSEVLKQFVWSEKVFKSKFQAFWEECFQSLL